MSLGSYSATNNADTMWLIPYKSQQPVNYGNSFTTKVLSKYKKFWTNWKESSKAIADRIVWVINVETQTGNVIIDLAVPGKQQQKGKNHWTSTELPG